VAAVAQHRFNPRSVRRIHGDNDRKQAINFASQLTSSDRELEALLKLLHIRAEQLIESHWYLVEAAAKALLERETMTEAEVRKVCQDATVAHVKAFQARAREELEARKGHGRGTVRTWRRRKRRRLRNISLLPVGLSDCPGRESNPDLRFRRPP
jgi:hypothetical protein